MPSVNDWMARAARQIRDDIGRGRVDRIAAVISIHAGDEVEKTKQTLLSVIPMEHVDCEDRDCTTYCGRCALRPLSFANLATEGPSVSVVEGTNATIVDRRETVDHPRHYGGADDPYEAIKVIEAWGLNFSLGSVLKYICRRDKKGSEIEDLKKARRYLDYEIARLSK